MVEAEQAALLHAAARGGPERRAAETEICRRFAPRIRLYGLRQGVIIHRLSGLALTDAERVGLSVRVEETDAVLVEQEDVPFSATEGEVLIACQRHFAAFPPNIVFFVTTKQRSGATRTDRFFVAHSFLAAK